MLKLMFGCGGRSSYRQMSYRQFPSLSLTGRFLDFDEFGVRGKFLSLPDGWTIFDAAYRIGFLSVVSWR